MTLETGFWFFLGLAGLVGGAELLVRGASRLAFAVGVSPLVIGLTVVAFGTSAPELSVSVNAALGGQTDMSVGNVVGSNIFNILVILGLSAAVAPLVVDQKLVRLEVPLMIATSLLVLGMALDGEVAVWEGAVLFVLCLAYVGLLALKGRDESPVVEEEWASGLGTAASSTSEGTGRLQFAAGSLGMVAAGLVLLVVGSGWLLESAVATARWLGVSELVIGLTLVAGGTSLPELATSVSASLQGKRDIAVGNVVGSNLFNILCVLGISATLSTGIPVRPISLYLDLPVMIAASVVCLPVFFSGGRVSRWEGGLLLCGYVVYIFCLYLFSA